MNLVIGKKVISKHAVEQSVAFRYRYYLLFTPGLQTLLENWHIGASGPSAYRFQFCLRKLVSEFSYVSAHCPPPSLLIFFLGLALNSAREHFHRTCLAIGPTALECSRRAQRCIGGVR